MKTITVPALLAVAMALAFAAAPISASERLRAGQWEITTTRPKLETTTAKRCVDAEEAASVNGDEKAFREYIEKHGGQACKIIESRLNGPSASYGMSCGEMTMRVTATYHGDEFEGDRSTKSGAGPERLSHFKAKRLGSCP
ncbi:MAG: DUF3617 domain-containing protein [Acidobacteriota bacterium]|nr:DUF3617 domain-containing protein [Acidobacteriota bacterium]